MATNGTKFNESATDHSNPSQAALYLPVTGYLWEPMQAYLMHVYAVKFAEILMSGGPHVLIRLKLTREKNL